MSKDDDLIRRGDVLAIWKQDESARFAINAIPAVSQQPQPQPRPDNIIGRILDYLEAIRVPDISDADKVRNDTLAVVRNYVARLSVSQQPQPDKLDKMIATCGSDTLSEIFQEISRRIQQLEGKR